MVSSVYTIVFCYVGLHEHDKYILIVAIPLLLLTAILALLLVAMIRSTCREKRKSNSPPTQNEQLSSAPPVINDDYDDIRAVEDSSSDNINTNSSAGIQMYDNMAYGGKSIQFMHQIENIVSIRQ